MNEFGELDDTADDTEILFLTVGPAESFCD